MADFDDLFHSLGYTENDPNWTVPKDWLMEDGSDPGYQLMSDQEIVETIMRIQTRIMKSQAHHPNL